MRRAERQASTLIHHDPRPFTSGGNLLSSFLALGALLGLLGFPGIAKAASGQFTEFPLPEKSAPAGITLGHEGDLWFTEWQAGKIGRITPSGQITEFPLPSVHRANTNSAEPTSITTGPEGNLWFTEPLEQKIVRLTPSGQMTEFEVKGGQRSEPEQIVAGPDGNLWFTEPQQERQGAENLTPEERRGAIGRITPDGQITEFPLRLPTARLEDTQPTGITAGPDGDLWFMESRDIGRITPGGQITESSFPGPLATTAIAAGSKGNFWIIYGSAIGRITPSGDVTSYPMPVYQSPAPPLVITGISHPLAITAGPEGNLWFFGSVPTGGKMSFTAFPEIGRVTPGGKISLVVNEGNQENHRTGGLPELGGITTGLEGDLWFTEPWDNHIARIAPSAVGSAFSVRIVGPSTPFVRNRRIHLRLSCAGGSYGSPCRGALRISVRRPSGPHPGSSGTIVLTHRDYSVAWESSASLSLLLNQRASRLLDREPILRAWVSVNVSGGHGEARTIYIEKRS
ncbi:MAG: hypothetical protein WB507_10710 [Solirubrobacterales bacterium]